jgi:hypothetical protein
MQKSSELLQVLMSQTRGLQLLDVTVRKLPCGRWGLRYPTRLATWSSCSQAKLLMQLRICLSLKPQLPKVSADCPTTLSAVERAAPGVSMAGAARTFQALYLDLWAPITQFFPETFHF